MQGTNTYQNFNNSIEIYISNHNIIISIKLNHKYQFQKIFIIPAESLLKGSVLSPEFLDESLKRFFHQESSCDIEHDIILSNNLKCH